MKDVQLSLLIYTKYVEFNMSQLTVLTASQRWLLANRISESDSNSIQCPQGRGGEGTYLREGKGPVKSTSWAERNVVVLLLLGISCMTISFNWPLTPGSLVTRASRSPKALVNRPMRCRHFCRRSTVSWRHITWTAARDHVSWPIIVRRHRSVTIC